MINTPENRGMNFNAEGYCNQAMHDWQAAYYSRDFAKCAEICEGYIHALKDKYLNYEFEGDDRTYVYVFLILIKGLEGMANLACVTSDQNWPNDDKLTEAIWSNLWITKRRFEFFQAHCLDQNLLERFTKRLDGLESYFYDEFGPGMYFSPEIRIKKSSCTVCKKNIKACEHLIGHIYNGVHCQEHVEEVGIESISIVKSPHDMRCRIWPWNVDKDERTVKGMFMCLEDIDTFLSPPKKTGK